MIRPSLRRGRGPAAPQSCKDDDTGLDYYDTLAGDIWRPRAEPGSRPAAAPRRPDGRSAIGHHNAP
jgi:hypothetical protein